MINLKFLVLKIIMIMFIGGYFIHSMQIDYGKY
jgi:hypothetical protein